MIKVLTKELSRSIDQEQKWLLRVTKFMVQLIGATRILENSPSAWFIFLNQACLMELFELQLSESIASLIINISLRDVKFH